MTILPQSQAELEFIEMVLRFWVFVFSMAAVLALASVFYRR